MDHQARSDMEDSPLLHKGLIRSGKLRIERAHFELPDPDARAWYPIFGHPFLSVPWGSISGNIASQARPERRGCSVGRMGMKGRHIMSSRSALGKDLGDY
jgi:hypothetical protein